MPWVEQKVLSALSESDIRALLRACQTERDKAIILFLLDSGARARELCAMNVGDVNLKTGSVFVSSGKGQKQRYAMVGAKTRKQLIRYFSAFRGGRPHEDEPLGLSLRGARTYYNGLAPMVSRLRERAGVDATLHAFRRTFAIAWLRSSMDIFTLQRLMGHSDIGIVKSYLPLVRDGLEKVHRKHRPLDNMTR